MHLHCPKPLAPPSALALALATAALTLAPAGRAEACGGFFCSNQPVIQTGERIIFSVDPDQETLRAIVQINYSGAAPDFAWILPLATAPEDLGVGTQRLFANLEANTAPRFTPTIDAEARCRSYPGMLVDASVGAFDAATSGGGGVVVVSQESVGPYATVVLQGTDVDAVRAWLVDRQYNVTDEMMRAVAPYLEKGDVLLALRLENDRTAGDVQPIAFTLRTREPCIPLRLTAIAAKDDMDVTAVVLSNAGRAVPSNYLHVEPNPARIDWLRYGANYRDLVSAAADEAGGNAFVTEYAGSTGLMRAQIYYENEYHLANIARETTLAGVVEQLAFERLAQRAELRAILARAVPDQLLRDHGLDPATYWPCPDCYRDQAAMIPFDPTALVAEIEQRIVTPDREAQALFDGHSTMTRLFTLISPSEMNLDPVFSFRDDLPDVNNQHTAHVALRCDASGAPTGGTLTLDDGSEILLGPSGLPVGAVADGAAADVISQLETGEVLKDNRALNRGAMMTPIAEVTPEGSSCGCGSVHAAADGSARGAAGLGLALLGLFGLALLSRR